MRSFEFGHAIVALAVVDDQAPRASPRAHAEPIDPPTIRPTETIHAPRGHSRPAHAVCITAEGVNPSNHA
ncbi:hypothetical protein CH295_09895 [Rhodococcus sp. 14-2483-1-2]|nr:hypothetical protein CH295_09895 [Rhodococcus sp. 14-2483-1-2]